MNRTVGTTKDHVLAAAGRMSAPFTAGDLVKASGLKRITSTQVGTILCTVGWPRLPKTTKGNAVAVYLPRDGR